MSTLTSGVVSLSQRFQVVGDQLVEDETVEAHIKDSGIPVIGAKALPVSLVTRSIASSIGGVCSYPLNEPSPSKSNRINSACRSRPRN